MWRSCCGRGSEGCSAGRGLVDRDWGSTPGGGSWMDMWRAGGKEPGLGRSVAPGLASRGKRALSRGGWAWTCGPGTGVPGEKGLACGPGTGVPGETGLDVWPRDWRPGGNGLGRVAPGLASRGKRAWTCGSGTGVPGETGFVPGEWQRVIRSGGLLPGRDWRLLGLARFRRRVRWRRRLRGRGRWPRWGRRRVGRAPVFRSAA